MNSIRTLEIIFRSIADRLPLPLSRLHQAAPTPQTFATLFQMFTPMVQMTAHPLQLLALNTPMPTSTLQTLPDLSQIIAHGLQKIPNGF